MGPLRVVVLAEVFDHDARLGQRPQLLAIETLVAEAAVEAFHEPVLPWTGRGDVPASAFRPSSGP